MNSACAEILFHKMLETPDSRRPPLFKKSGGTQHFLIVSTNFQRHICAPTEGSPSQGELSAELTEGVPSILY